MQTKPKSNSIITSRYDEARNVIIFTVVGQGDLKLDLGKVSKANLARAAIHGFNQRIPDAAALGVTDKDGAVIPRDERTRIKFRRMEELCLHYESGTEEWGRKGTGDGGGSRSITIEAIARVKGLSYEEAAEKVKVHADTCLGGDTKKALAQLRKAAAVQEMITAIRAERDAKRILAGENPADDILNDL